MKDYRNIIFDLYGTLIDIHTDEERPFFWKSLHLYFRQYNIDYDPKDIRKDYLLLCKREEKKRKGKNIEIDLFPVFETLLNEKGISGKEEEFASYFRKSSTTHIRLYSGCIDLLTSLRESGKNVYLLSNAQALFTNEELKDLRIIDLFDGIILSSDIGYKKPDRRIFRALIERFHLNAEECLFIGNDEEADIYGAQRASLDTFYIHSGLSPKEKGTVTPDYFMRGMDLKKLKRMLLK